MSSEGKLYPISLIFVFLISPIVSLEDSITALTPYVINILGNNPGLIFYFFGFMMILQLVFVLRMMPETKGISLEEMKFNS